MTSSRGRIVAGLIIIMLLASFLLTCDDRQNESERARKAEAQRQAQLQSQLNSEEAQRIEAQRNARAAEESRNFWVSGLGAGACIACGIVLLVGIHIGSRAVRRYRKEHDHNA